MELSNALLLGGILALVMGAALVFAGYWRDAHPPRRRPRPPVKRT
ncbi:hypothetical protein FHX74_001385 [Friedmanniella endophytica]|uniref:Uncharacterized protein n=1 Tax=Microlunatus kandeliicorticis TaxID=1759536 RepID=A0A7W3IRB6_9ACTN|nr:hypothetical protein [Microlunatus kandeliicorticis]MBA8793780.1 hypothetical protein [Microlunatus kandeliicorticis]